MQGTRLRGGVALIALCIMGAPFVAGGSASATPVGGAIHVFMAPSNDGVHAAVVITGAIGDYGKALFMDKNGKPDPNGDYARFTLQKGGFEANATALVTKSNSGQANVNAATCSAEQSVTAPVSLLDGSGLYQAITGTISVTTVFAGVAPRYATGKNKGECNKNAQPVAQYFSVQGSGTVSFP